MSSSQELSVVYVGRPSRSSTVITGVEATETNMKIYQKSLGCTVAINKDGKIKLTGNHTLDVIRDIRDTFEKKRQ
jgi:translation initiation factor 1 (eIF-1/SUI1)